MTYAIELGMARRILGLICIGGVLLSGCQKTLPVVMDDAQRVAPGAGSGAAGSTGAMSGSVKASAAAPGGDQTVATAAADIAPFGDSQVTGQFTFEQDSGGVSGTLIAQLSAPKKILCLYIRRS